MAGEVSEGFPEEDMLESSFEGLVGVLKVEKELLHNHNAMLPDLQSWYFNEEDR